MNLRLLRTALFLWIGLMQSPAARALDVDWSELPELSSHKAQVRLGYEIEVMDEGLANIIQYFEVPGVDPKLSNLAKAQAVMRNVKLLDTMTVREDAPAELRHVLSRLEWVDGGGCIEFRHKVPTDNPELYMRDVNVLSRQLGILEKINNPLRFDIAGPWFSYHTHHSTKKAYPQRQVAEAMNIMKAVQYAAAGHADYALGDGLARLEMDIELKGQVRLFSEDRIEVRRQVYSPEQELRLNLFLMTIDPKDAVEVMADLTALEFTPAVIKQIRQLQSVRSGFVLKRALRLIFEHSQQKLAPEGLEYLWSSYHRDHVPAELLWHYRSMLEPYRKSVRELLRSRLTAMDTHGKLFDDKIALRESFMDHSSADRRIIAEQVASSSDLLLKKFFVEEILPLDAKLLDDFAADFAHPDTRGNGKQGHPIFGFIDAERCREMLRRLGRGT